MNRPLFDDMKLKVAVGDLPDDQEFAYCIYLILAIIIALTFLVLLYITVKVIQKVGASDKVIPLMLFFLQICALCKYISFILYLYCFLLFPYRQRGFSCLPVSYV